MKIAVFLLFCCGLSHAQEAKWFISDHKIRTEDGLRVLRVGTACCVYPGGEVFLLPSWEPIKSVYPEELGTLEAAQKIMANKKAAFDAACQHVAAEEKAKSPVVAPVETPAVKTVDSGRARNAAWIIRSYQRDIDDIMSGNARNGKRFSGQTSWQDKKIAELREKIAAEQAIIDGN